MFQICKFGMLCKKENSVSNSCWSARQRSNEIFDAFHSIIELKFRIFQFFFSVNNSESILNTAAPAHTIQTNTHMRMWDPIFIPFFASHHVFVAGMWICWKDQDQTSLAKWANSFSIFSFRLLCVPYPLSARLSSVLSGPYKISGTIKTATQRLSRRCRPFFCRLVLINIKFFPLAQVSFGLVKIFFTVIFFFSSFNYPTRIQESG